MYEVQIMDSAKKDMRDVYRYISRELQNVVAAEHRISLIQDKIKSLRESPYRYPLVLDEYLAAKGVRSISAKKHMVFYIICEKGSVVENVVVERPTVFAMRVLYSHRDWATLLTVDSGEWTVESCVGDGLARPFSI